MRVLKFNKSVALVVKGLIGIELNVFLRCPIPQLNLHLHSPSRIWSFKVYLNDSNH